jgi:hypothetical protein
MFDTLPIQCLPLLVFFLFCMNRTIIRSRSIFWFLSMPFVLGVRFLVQCYVNDRFGSIHSPVRSREHDRV